MATRISTATRNAIADAAADRPDAGAGAGIVRIYSGAQPATAETAPSGTLLATITLGDPAFGNAVAGVITANAIVEDVGDVAGTAGWFRVLDSDLNTCWDGSVGLDPSAEDMDLNTLTVSVGVAITITAWTLTAPAA